MKSIRISQIFIVLCALSISAPLLCWPFLPTTAESAENRKLHVRPDLMHSVTVSGSIAKGLVLYLDSLDDFFSDNFPFRTTLVKLHHFIKIDILDIDPTPNKVIKGNNNWYFLGDSYGSVIQEVCGLKVFASSNVHRIDSLIDSYADWCDRRGIAYRVATVRDKNSVYPDVMGLPIRPGKKKFDQILELDAGMHAVVDMSAGFNEHRRLGLRLYHRTDSHWNSMGAYFGYAALMRSLADSGLNFEIIPLETLTIDTIQGKPGDLSVLLNRSILEDRIQTRFKFREYGYRTISKLTVPKNEFFPEPYEQRFINPKKKYKVIIFRDSFSSALIPYMKETFGEVILIWGSRFDHDLIEKEDPDIVITELVGRNLDELLIGYKGQR